MNQIYYIMVLKDGGFMEMFEAVCIRQDYYGNGFVEVDSTTISVSGLLLGEVAKIERISPKKGKIVKIIKPSPVRTKAPCPYYAVCGGCQVQHIKYEMQLQEKLTHVQSCFQANQLPTETILFPIGSKNPFYYRSKAQMVISEKNKRIRSGFYEENSHKIVNVDACMIQDEKTNQIIQTIRELLEKHKIPVYQEDHQNGLIRHIMVKHSPTTKQILVIFVTSEEKFPGRNNVVTELRQRHPEITTIVQNVNPRKTSVVLGDFERVLYGSGKIEDVMLENRFLISSKTFYQVNHSQTEILYKKALEFAKPTVHDVVLDAYCGVGAIGLLFAKKAKKVIAVDINPESITNAIQNAKLNQIRNIRFFKEDSVAFLHQLADSKENIDIIVFDPPRSGLDPTFIEAIHVLKPKKIVYISCEPESLSRDLVQLVAGGYGINRVQPIDLFPQTFHIENVVLLERTIT